METVTPPDQAATKRKRTPSESAPSGPLAKVSKTGNSSLSINYLAHHTQDDLPLLNKEDTLPNLLQLLSAYSNVLDRHESLASNLGARPLGPILIKRFERCFDAPPKIVASHHKGASTSSEETGHQITWLEVIEFARSHPSQFTLSTFSEGKRVCQFYYPQKQLRVQISEEDFLFINSGRCQELIPPLPIWEDEEKEVGTCDVLEIKLKELTNLADMVAARTRQLSHRLKGRRAAILERRAEGGSGTPAKITAQQTTTAPPSSSGSGFVATNANHERLGADIDTSTTSFTAVRTELLKHFESLPQNHANPRPHSRHHSTTTYADSTAQPTARHIDHTHNDDEAASTNSSLSPVPPNLPADPLSYYVSEDTPAARGSQAPAGSHHRASVSIGGQTYNVGPAPVKHNFSRPLPPALENSQPFRPLCQAHMDGLPRGHRVLPPCDRCRRLRMDCVKNLTSCAGCTKKHTRCHWRDVSREELGDLDHLMDSVGAVSGSYAGEHTDGLVNGSAVYDDPDESDDDDSNPLEDLEALGEKEEQREKEIAERAKEDEEGLRNARELARQGREASTYTQEQNDGSSIPKVNEEEDHSTIPKATITDRTNHGDTSTYRGPYTQDPTLDSIGHEHSSSVQNAVSVQPINNVDTNKIADQGPRDVQTEAAARRASIASATFVPLPAQPPQTVVAPSFGGFHAVNGTSSGTAWRST